MERNEVLSKFVYPLFTSVASGLILSFISLFFPSHNEHYSLIGLWLKILGIFIFSTLIIFLLIYKYRNKTKPIKVIVFDFDGTLTCNNKLRSSWELIWIKLGYTISDCESLYNKFKNKKITHQEWCNLTCNKFIQKNLTEETLKSISKEIQLMDNVKEVLNEMRESGLKLYLVSGSIIQLIKYIWGDDLDSYFNGYKANQFRFKNGVLKEIVGTKYDFEGKAKYIKRIAQIEKLNSTSEILFIGNSDNDEYAYQSGAQTLCFNPRIANPANKKIWHKHIRSDSFRELFEYIKKSYSFEES